MKTPILETKQLFLRPVLKGDAQSVFNCWENDPDVSRYMFWESHSDINKTKAWVSEEILKIKESTWYRWIILSKETKEIVGTCLLYDAENNGQMHVGYNLGKKYWGQGYITEAMTEAIEFAKKELCIIEFLGSHAIENPASGRVLEKLGFKYVSEIPYDCGPGNIEKSGKQYLLKTKKLGTLTNKERTENYYSIKRELEADGYSSEVKTISIIAANLLAFVTAGPIAIVCLVIYYMIHGLSFEQSFLDIIIWYAFILISIPVHEGLHGIGWVVGCKNGWKSIQFGVVWKMLTPYCCCLEIMSFRKYLFGGLLPFLVLGIGGFIVALVMENGLILAIALFNILAAGGDTTIVFMLLKHRNKIIIDHPSECGFIAFAK